jgi:hypothetical protein
MFGRDCFSAALCPNQLREIEDGDLATECVHTYRLPIYFVKIAQTRDLSQKIDFTYVRLKSENRSATQSRLIPDERKISRKPPWPGVERSEGHDKAAKIGGRAGIADIQIVGHARASMEGGGQPTDYNKIDARAGEGLNRRLKLHQERLRAMPNSFQHRRRDLQLSRPFRRRQPQNCSTSSVKSTPKSRAASIRLPRAG